MSRLEDLTGRAFGHWTALRREPAERVTKWLCLCACGSERLVQAGHLKSGASTNCGCQRRPRVAHGHATRAGRTRTYRIWKAMRSRCRPDAADARNYHDRGIAICARWESYEAFLDDMGEAPPGMTLDRIDNDLGYAPDNCRWADHATQRENQRRVAWVMFDGDRMPVKGAAGTAPVFDLE